MHRFLWVAFQIKELSSKRTDEEILDALEDLPKDLPSTFDRILRRLMAVKPNELDLTKKLFQVVAAALRPLELQELQQAISVDPGDTHWDPKQQVNDMMRVLDCCESLLDVDEENLTVHFAHHSVKQYLTTNPSCADIGEYHFRLNEADLLLGEICVTYLNYGIFSTKLTIRSTDTNKDGQDIVANLPAAILTGLLPGSIISKKLALRLVKTRGNPKPDIQHHLREVNEMQEPLHHHHPFLSYSQKYWLQHTTFIFKASERVYKLWSRLGSGDVDIVQPPWASEEWNSPQSKFIEFAKSNRHLALLCHLLVATRANTYWDNLDDTYLTFGLVNILPLDPQAHIFDLYGGRSNLFQLANIGGQYSLVTRLHRLGFSSW